MNQGTRVRRAVTALPHSAWHPPPNHDTKFVSRLFLVASCSSEDLVVLANYQEGFLGLIGFALVPNIGE